MRRILSIILMAAIISTYVPMNVHAATSPKASSNVKTKTIDAGYGHSMAIQTDGSLWSWGRNTYGQLGDGTTEDRLTPKKIINDALSVAAGFHHSMVIKSDGSLWTFGANGCGQLGNGTHGMSAYSNPIKIMTNVVAIAAGDSHSMAIKSDGSLWTWGLNEDGQLGDGTTDARVKPIKIMDDVVDIDAGKAYSIALKSDGSLWAFGENFTGQLGDGTTEDRLTPVKVMDDIIDIDAGYEFTLAVKSNGDLWGFGSNGYHRLDARPLSVRCKSPVKIMADIETISAGHTHCMAIQPGGTLLTWGGNRDNELGDGTRNARNLDEAVEIMKNTAAIAAVFNYSLAVQSDGSLWAWGWNISGQLGDGSTDNISTPIKIMDNVMLPSEVSFTQTAVEETTEAASLVYEEDPAADLTLPTDKLETVTDKDSAAAAVKAAAGMMTSEQKESSTGIDKATLYAEEAAAQAAKTEAEGSDISVTGDMITTLAAKATEATAAVEAALAGSGIKTARELSTSVKIAVADSEKTVINLDQAAANSSIDNIIVESDNYSIKIPTSAVKSDAGTEGLKVTIEEAGVLTGSLTSDMLLIGGTGNGSGKSFKVSFNKDKLTENVTIALPPVSGSTQYQAIVKTDGTAVGGKYNPTTKKLEAKINTAGTYTVKQNEKDFTDIQAKNKEMQEAIKVLASKGIIGGTTETTFSPDKTITRAEIAAIILRTLGKLDASQDGKFTDVSKSDWYFGTAGSSKKYGIVTGYPDGSFKGKTVIPKEQIIAVAARTLKQEMKYKDPANAAKYLAKYKDTSSISTWATGSVALGTRENLVITRSDGRFAPKENITRGEAAVILKRLFDKIW